MPAGSTSRRFIALGLTLLFFTSIFLSSSGSLAQRQIELNGAGATFPYPLIDTWRVEYQKIRPDVSINYQSIGSGGGVKQFTEKTVDFGASDAPLTSSEIEKVPGAVHIPETIGSIVVSYNIPEFQEKGLKLTGPILADIFLGKITKWNDPRIQDLNPDLSLPSKNIIVAHRSDGSGTTFVWTDYLSKISPEWKRRLARASLSSGRQESAHPAMKAYQVLYRARHMQLGISSSPMRSRLEFLMHFFKIRKATLSSRRLILCVQP